MTDFPETGATRVQRIRRGHFPFTVLIPAEQVWLATAWCASWGEIGEVWDYMSVDLSWRPYPDGAHTFYFLVEARAVELKLRFG